ncbi:hypothetical protein HDU92_002877 [Lobulomyces angularis]|nr:hypothetical protein HDU92_002877 [Lobulomyces angularis]
MICDIYTLIILSCVSINQIFVGVNFAHQFRLSDKNTANNLTDTVLLRYSYYKELVPCVLSIINYVLYFFGINLTLFMASERYYKLHAITPKSRTSFIITGIKFSYLFGSMLLLSYIIFDFLIANTPGYPYELLKLQLSIFSCSFFIINFYAGIMEFFFNLMMIRTVIHSMKGGAIKKNAQKIAKIQMISMLVLSVLLEVIAGVLYVGAGQIVEIKAIGSIPTFVHLIISTMLLEMLNNISQVIRELSNRRSLQTTTDCSSSNNKSLTSDVRLNLSDYSEIPDLLKYYSDPNLCISKEVK